MKGYSVRWRDIFWVAGQGLGVGSLVIIIRWGISLLLLQSSVTNHHLFKFYELLFSFLVIVVLFDIAYGIHGQLASPEYVEEDYPDPGF